MKISLIRELILQPLSVLTSVSTTKQLTFPILSNVLFIIKNKNLILTVSDLEVEVSQTLLNIGDVEDCEFTIPSRKLHDIVKGMPENSLINFSFSELKVTITSGRSRFILSTLAANEYPLFDHISKFSSLKLSQKNLKRRISNIEFCMALKDVRYYLNGLLFEIHDSQFNFVTTDGHRLAFDQTESFYDSNLQLLNDDSRLQVLLPRKSILDLKRLLNDSDEQIEIQICSSYVKFIFESYSFITKLIDSKFPEYSRVIPSSTNLLIELNRIDFLEALQRVAILSSDQFRAIRLEFSEGQLVIYLHSPEHEEVKEELSVNYSGEDLTIGFNIIYLIDVLNHVEDTNIQLNFTESLSSCLLSGDVSDLPLYVVMPMRL